MFDKELHEELTSYTCIRTVFRREVPSLKNKKIFTWLYWHVWRLGRKVGRHKIIYWHQTRVLYMYVYVVDSQFQFKAKNLIKGLGDHVIFLKNEITSYATILLFINSISTVTLSLVKKNVINGYYFYCHNLISTSAKYMSVKGQLHL